MTHQRISIAGLRNAGAAQDILIAGVGFTADASGALYLEAESLIVVADLHLEKGSSYARRRVLLPPYDTAATLAHLTRVIARYNPRRVVALGDSFHDRDAAARMGNEDRASLRALQAGRDWIWIAGNHDPLPPASLLGEAHDEIRVGPITFRHEPRAGDARGEIAGHLHPVARVVTTRGSLRRRCFASDGARCVMPAFGAYAGGLNLRDIAFAPLFPGRAPHAHVLGRDRVYAIGHEQCHSD
ncbi:MAG: phosphoesterase [Hyphomicrobiales bacterium]|nr:phosphoesterase [Hyphomicrobiales bacterium]